jgi:Flp pilus assembly protein TadD
MSNYKLYGDAKATATAADGNRKQKALDSARKRVEENPSAANQAALASALFDIGKYDEAEKLLMDVTSQHGQELPVLFELGFIYKNLGRKDEAVAAWMKIVELDAKHSLARAAENEVWMLDPNYRPSWLRK